MSELYLPDTPEGRAIEQIVDGLTAGPDKVPRAVARKLARIAAEAMVRLEGPEAASSFFIGVSRDLLQRRGCGKGSKRSD